MASPDTQPWVYDFRFNYYENYYRNRIQQMSSTASFFNMWEEAWKLHDDTVIIGGVAVNHGVDIRAYVQRHYNGDTPKCLTDKILAVIRDFTRNPIVLAAALVSGIGLVVLVAAVVIDLVASLLGSFIVTATTNVLGQECAKNLIDKMKTYRDTRLMSEKDIKNMLRYYSVIGPRIVDALNSDLDNEAVYKYIYAEYISRLDSLMDADDRFEVMTIYFNLIDDMIERYNIKTSKRFIQWRQIQQY